MLWAETIKKTEAKDLRSCSHIKTATVTRTTKKNMPCSFVLLIFPPELPSYWQFRVQKSS